VQTVTADKIPHTEVERASLTWIKAQASTYNGQCVEIAWAAGNVAIRDSKDPNGLILLCTPAEFKAFLNGTRDGKFDSSVV
jgi:hypothetical protein